MPAGPDSMKKLLLIRGDCSGAGGFVRLWWYLFRFLIWWRWRGSHSVQVLEEPNLSVALDAISGCDVFVFYGHGNVGQLRLQAKGDHLLAEHVQQLTSKRETDIELVQLSCCDSCRDDEWVAAWLEVTPHLRGYTGVTYDIKRPISIPQCLSFHR